MSLTSRWVFINSGAVTKLFGISLANPLAMVMEYFEDGQLDTYLSNPDNRSTITEVNLVEAAASLANAVYYLVSNSVFYRYTVRIECYFREDDIYQMDRPFQIFKSAVFVSIVIAEIINFFE